MICVCVAGCCDVRRRYRGGFSSERCAPLVACIERVSAWVFVVTFMGFNGGAMWVELLCSDGGTR